MIQNGERWLRRAIRQVNVGTPAPGFSTVSRCVHPPDPQQPAGAFG